MRVSVAKADIGGMLQIEKSRQRRGGNTERAEREIDSLIKMRAMTAWLVMTPGRLVCFFADIKR